MNFGLIGHNDHWTQYAQMMRQLPEVALTAVTIGSAEDSLKTFTAAPGVTDRTTAYSSAAEMFAREKLDFVQVATRPDLIPEYIKLAFKHGVPVMAEKPIAMDLDTLDELYQSARENDVQIAAMHTQRSDGALGAVKQIVEQGKIGKPLLCHSQKSYKWRGNRPDFFRHRQTFPGIAAYVGLHAIDWMFWILGDVFESVTGCGTQSVFASYPGCESHAGFFFRLRDHAAATLNVDYLRSSQAPTHGDERVRVAGPGGIVESAFNEGFATLTDGQGINKIDSVPGVAWYASFVRSLQGGGKPFLSVGELFRITEIALKAQGALDSRETVSLTGSPYQ